MANPSLNVVRGLSSILILSGLAALAACEPGAGLVGDAGPAGEVGPRGRDGFSSLVLFTTELPGVHCATGGKRIDVGLDDGSGDGTARDNLLQPGEVRSSTYVCNGADGLVTLVMVTAEPAGTNCPSGGQKVQSGLDDGRAGATARDGILQPGEVTSTAFICDGDGAHNSLLRVTSESAGASCARGGQRIDSGIDDGRNDGVADDGLLQPGEIGNTSYVCNGTDGAAATRGHDALVRVSGEGPGSNCATGGKRLDSGVDDGAGGGVADDGTLETGEVHATSYVCNGATGATGFDSLAAVSAIPPGGVCASGGVTVSVGRDNGASGGTARDGILQAGEVESTSAVCNGARGADGADGADGANGYSSLLDVTPVSAGADCANGGQHILAGLDDGSGGGIARDGVLQAGETTIDRFVCNGIDGTNGGACTPAPGALDQAQLDNPGWYIGLSASQEPVGQTFVAGVTGKLTGIELGIHRCGRNDATATVELAVSDDLGSVIATASLPVSQLDDGCSSGGLDPGAVTAAFFDLSAQCVQVTAGQSLSLSVTLDHLTPSSCDPMTHRCTGTGQFCFADFQCGLSLNVDDGPDTYAAGTETVRGDPQGEDLTFKTFVH